MPTGTSRGRGSSSYRSNYTYKGKKKRKKRGIGTLGKVLILLVLSALIVTALILTKKTAPAEEKKAAETTAPETELDRKITLEGIDLDGKTRSMAKQAVLQKYPWSVKVSCSGAETPEYALANIVEPSVDKVLDRIYGSLTPAKDTYTVDWAADEALLASELDQMKALWEHDPVNGQVEGYDAQNGAFVYTDGAPGTSLDTDALREAIVKAVADRKFSAEITAPVTQTAPKYDAETVKDLYQVIGTFTTNTTSNADRNNNIKTACAAINGFIVKPGEEFTFNHTTGHRTAEKGYKAAGAYQNGVFVQEPGGGVCQVSTTLYNAVVRAGILNADGHLREEGKGLDIVERHSHTYEPSYVTPGEDAMVSFDGYVGPDMRFINRCDTAVAIRASYADRVLTVSIIGLPILEEGVSIGLHSEKTAEYDPPATPTYVDDPTMELGVEQVVSEGTKGSQWQTYITYKKNGELLSDTKFHSSTYKGHAPEVKKNMQGVVVPTEPETLAGGEIIDETVIAGPGGPGDQTETQAGPSSEGPSSQAGPSETKSKQDNEGPSQGGPSQSEAAPETAAPQTEAPSRPSERESDVNNAPGGNGDAPSVPDAPGGGEIETIAPHPGA